MRFKTERDAFADAVAWAGRTVPARPTLPILGGILLELDDDDRLRLASTDLDHTGQATIQIADSTVVDGVDRAVVPGRVFGDVVRALPAGAVEVEADAATLTIRCGEVSHELRLLDVDDYPTLPATKADAPSGTLPGQVLAVAAAQVARTAGTDEARPVLTAVLLEAEPERLTFAATDTYRLALRDITGDNEGDGGWRWEHDPASALVPARSLAEAAKAMAGADTVTITIESRQGRPFQATFTGGHRRLTTRLVEGEFPPVRKLLPDSGTQTATVDRQTLLDACKQVAPYGQNNNPIRLTFAEGRLTVAGSVQDVGAGRAVIDAKYDAEPVTVGLNPTYLTDGVGGVEDGEVVIEITDRRKPLLIHGNDRRGFTCLLMPVRIAE